MRKMNIRRPMCVICLMFVLSVYIVLLLSGGVDLTEYVTDHKTVEINGKITEKIYKNNKYRLHIKADSNNKCFIAYLENQNAFDFKLGQNVVIKGNYQNFPLPENEGQFNTRKYYRIRGYEASIYDAKVISSGTKYALIKEWLFKIKERTKKIYGLYMEDSEAGTLSAMVLGDKADLDEDIKDMYQAAGISHILSLSGLHIAAVGMCAFSFIRLFVNCIPFSAILSSIIMILYGTMTGFSTSTFRALIMFSLAIIAKCIGRTYDLLSAVSLASILIIFENPYYVYDSGFLLSVMSVAGIALIYPIMMETTDIFKEEKSTFYERIRQSICISISTSLTTLPIVLNTFYKVSRYSIFINIIIVPLMSVLLGIGILVLLIGNAFIEVNIICNIVEFLLFFAEKILDLYSIICGYATKVYGNSWVVGEGKTIQTIVYIILTAFCIIVYEVYRNRTKYLDDYRIQWRLRKRLRVVELFVLVASVLVLAYRHKPEISINSLSVGQGACNVIYGRNNPTVMIDSGSIDVKDVYKNRVKPFLLFNGINEIDYIFVTHPDTDHISGVKELLEDETNDVRVRHLFLSIPDEETVMLAKKKKVNVHIMSAGDSVNNGDIRIECLSPRRQNREESDFLGNGTNAKETTNDESLVLKLTFKDKNKSYVSLFTGDISSEKEKELLGFHDVNNKIRDVDLMSVAHHGSKYSSCKEFIEAVDADVFVISAGKNNSYGHPHKETLERLDEYAPSAKVLRTDECGQITVMLNKNIMINRFLYPEYRIIFKSD